MPGATKGRAGAGDNDYHPDDAGRAARNRERDKSNHAADRRAAQKRGVEEDPMKAERFQAAVAGGETLICEIPRRPEPPEIVTGIATMIDEVAHVRTADGTLRNAEQWPSHAYMFTEQGHPITGAVIYGNAAATADRIMALTPLPPVSAIVETLADEIEGYYFTNEDWLEVIDALGNRLDRIDEHPRVQASKRARSEQQDARRRAEEAREIERLSALEAMTAIASGEASRTETEAIRTAVRAAIETHTDGTAKLTNTKRFGELPCLKARTDESALAAMKDLGGIAVPVSQDEHLILQRHVRVRWQESPDESDVSGIFHCARGRRVNRTDAGKHNTRIIRSKLQKEAARATLEASLTETSDSLPKLAVEIKAARDLTPGGHGTQWWRLPSDRVAQTTRQLDWPTKVASSTSAISDTALATGLGLQKKDIPTLEAPRGE